MIFGKKKSLLNIKCVWYILQMSPETFLNLRRIQRQVFM